MGLKNQISLPIAAGVLLLGIPCSVSLVVQWIYGWPNKPGYRKYIEALKPRRVYCLTVAMLEMMKYLQYGKLYFQWNSWYKNIANNSYCEKDIRFGRHGNKLDLYYSPNMDQPDCSASPVIIFVYGGAWGSGKRSIYCLLALQMAKELNASVVCPDYSIYPKGTVLEMVQDIADSILWVRENCHMFNLDKESITLIGHSAGAHLCALTTAFLAAGYENLGIEVPKQKELALSVKGVVGLSGVYHIKDHYLHEIWRGVEHVSTMHKAMGELENFDHYSPTLFIKALAEDNVKSLPPFTLLHGTRDVIVPVESSVKFSEALTSVSARVALYLLPKVDHIQIVTDLMAPDRQHYHTVFGCIKQEFNKDAAKS
ncbi:uncharacterized protein [Lepisosteus oculatus]|uniref:uncharacterized protein isoform X1 n=1 Tax=Lepisosteus oculatus TaxID=7918 RepID=UPI0003EA8C06|nr:PREDICTED: probable isoprenylcysteine alpha-carbonyl methylesterase ICMEL2 isoform X1 [Lepisosteus oculatus]XP_015219799.1 PREDICTED: probable isoprenylcysteine alpha-carbonyl methylesterase ICMEL2 isoform X1 [Lepisosteus oculatus]